MNETELDPISMISSDREIAAFAAGYRSFHAGGFQEQLDFASIRLFRLGWEAARGIDHLLLSRLPGASARNACCPER